MNTCRKNLFIILFCAISPFLNAQKDSGNTFTLKLDKGNVVHVQMPGDNGWSFKDLVPYFPGLAILVTLIGIWVQTKSNRDDENKKNHLERISRQISELYMPLHAQYEKGDKNWYSFKDLYGEPVDFDNPHYTDWASLVFKNTNICMRDIITKKADLIIGDKIPKCLLDFSSWADAFEIYLHAHEKRNFNNEDWKDALKGHPEVEMQAYLSASVEVLKKQQNLLLTGKKTIVDETELESQVINLIPVHIEEIKNHPYRKGVWKRVKEKEKQKQEQNISSPDPALKIPDYTKYIPAMVFTAFVGFLIKRKARKTLQWIEKIRKG